MTEPNRLTLDDLAALPTGARVTLEGVAFVKEDNGAWWPQTTDSPTYAESADLVGAVLVDPDDAEHARNLGTLLDRAATALAEVLAYWQEHDLPGEFLTPGDPVRPYPFRLSLDEQVEEVRHAADVLTGRDR